MREPDQQNSRSCGLYRPQFEHDNCGIGAVVNIKGMKSHKTVEDALNIVENLEHRAGKDAEGKTGDGVGILLQISHKFFSAVCQDLGIFLGSERHYGVAMIFFPQQEYAYNQARKMFEIVLKQEGLNLLGFREVPSRPEVLGRKARQRMPRIVQAFIEKPGGVRKGLDFDRRLYVARRVFEQSSTDTYVCSMSSRTIVYKGMFLVDELRTFFTDLQDSRYESAIALVHSRFSTNTNPSWERAHPNRLMVHNGEINTIRGNADKMQAREETFTSGKLHREAAKILPVIHSGGSDSAMLDNTLEFFMMEGMELPLAIMAAIPEPWENQRDMPQEKRDFYQYYATMMEPWDGPAAILFSDGDIMGAVLDRNGLRPSRYMITRDGNMILASEVGILAIPDDQIIQKDRLRPGRMLLVDTVQGKIIDDDELKARYIRRRPYGEWLYGNLLNLEDLKIPNVSVDKHSDTDRGRLQKVFGYSYEEYRTSICEMALNGQESVGAMGADTPLAILSDVYQPLFHYFKQLFAQVTNPPIDAIREEIVTSTTVYLGRGGNLLRETPANCHVLKIENPILSNTDMLKIRFMKQKGFKIATVPIVYYKSLKLEQAIEQVFLQVDKAYQEGVNILILSDRGVDETHMPIPSLLAVSAVHKYLVRTKRRTSLSLILESGEPREVHHFATLLGYGASAVNPYLALESIEQLIAEHLLEKDYYAAVKDYTHAVLHGIVKIASKMGISTIQSYQGAQIFEAVGISQPVIDRYFTDTVSRIGGLGLAEIEIASQRLFRSAFDPLGLDTSLRLDSIGRHQLRSEGEQHRYNPRTIHLLQEAARQGDYQLFKEYTRQIDQETSGYIRSCLEFVYPRTGVPLEEVERAASIVKRFKTGAMSYGSISLEAHETMAVAMNRLQGRSNSGEGGESEERLCSKGQEYDTCSAIKQVASGRFGVTSRYLVSADEIQIKMAQGAKPGEGGHLPGKKVYPWIARTRHSTAGVSLISPPPHHDIYSIEDLAQLIYDLQSVNKDARISVKLVSEAGVGTVAAGVAKAGARVILISGYDGGTGAAPKSSIHHAGLPWELGLAEAHQTLQQNGLRERVIVETDGKLMSGRDVVIAALLGAQEFGFATAPLVTMGCVMMRVCHQDTCPVGVATQNPELRKRFAGKPEHIVNFMTFIAEELREYMARLGIRTVDELVGRTDLLRQTDKSRETYCLDLSQMLNNPYLKTEKKALSCYDFELEKTLDETVLARQWRTDLQSGEKKRIKLHVTNTNRSFGTMFGTEITRIHPDGLAEDTFTVECSGAGGQSFGAFIPRGLTLSLCGDSNDYFGKGLSGGKLILYPPYESTFRAEDNMITGNVALYGATSGTAYISGIAGERFAVRNSGAVAVVEGVGDHGCEYMTGGTVVILGSTGKNFAAGMSGGVAYVLDEENKLYRNINETMISMGYVNNKSDQEELKRLIEAHVEATGSGKGKEILSHFPAYVKRFKKIIPDEYSKVITITRALEQKGMSRDEAQLEAFYQSTAVPAE